LRLFSFGGYGLALAALALVVFSAYDSYPFDTTAILPRFWQKKSVFVGRDRNVCFGRLPSEANSAERRNSRGCRGLALP